jgi:carboxyl-terminal processing protease
MKRYKWLISASLIITLSMGLFAFKDADNKYFEIAKNLDIYATLIKELNIFYVDEINATKLIKTSIDEMLQSLDPYTNYIPEDDIEDYRTMTTGQYGGIGAIIGRRNNKNMIMQPYQGWPADKAGLLAGDELIKVEQTDVTKMNTSDISKLLKGQPGTKVMLTVKKYGEEKNTEVELTREKIKIENIPYSGMVNNEIGYMLLTDFTQNAGKDIKKAVEDLKSKGAKKIIFDLRDNPGGLLHEAVNISNVFIEKDREIVSTRGKVSDWNKVYKTLDQPLDLNIPVVVLTSGRSASASEIVSGVIQDYDRGVIIGEKTFGKGLVQATRPLSYNSQLKVTTAKYYTPSGRCIQAIDYSNRDDDGRAKKNADSLKVAFKTKNGRTVYDGGGIDPDIKVERKELSALSATLLTEGLIFDYACKFRKENKTIPAAREFTITDAEYEKFVNWLSGKKYTYETKSEKVLTELLENVEKEKFGEEVKTKLSLFKDKLQNDKNADLVKFKDEIKEILENEIVTRYYYQKGTIEASFDDDVFIKSALDLFADMDKYQKILKGEKQ